MKKSGPLQTVMKANTEGVFYGIPETVYRKAPGLNQSLIKPLAISPAHFQTALTSPITTTAALTFGRIAHHLLLTPKLPKFWAVKPLGMDMRSELGKCWKRENTLKTWVDWETWLNIESAVKAARQHPVVAAALENGKREVTWFKFYMDCKRKVRRKGRIDVVTPGQAICDFKFVEDAREHAFRNQILERKWHLQAGYYLDGYNDATKAKDTKTQFVFFAVEKTPPFAVNVWKLEQDAIARGRNEYTALLNLYLDCRAKAEWPVSQPGDNAAYSTEIKTIGLPKWANKGNATKGEFIIQ
jgi:exodeoxyribonuclease VIII